MARDMATIFTAISGTCAFILSILLFHFICFLKRMKSQSKKSRKKNVADPLVRIFGTVSLLGYTTYVLLVFLLDLFSSLWYFDALQLPYIKLICQMQAFTIAFFMMVCTDTLIHYFVVTPRGHSLGFRVNSECGSSSCHWSTSHSEGPIWHIHIGYSSRWLLHSLPLCTY